MTVKIWRLLGALVALTLLLAACGSDGTTETTTDDAVAEDDTEAMDDEHGDDDDGDDHADDHSDDDDDDDHGDDEHGDDDHGDDHAHGSSSGIDVDPAAPIPNVGIEVTETDTPGVFALTVTLANFTITPDNVDGDPIENEGHMHYLLNGSKVDRFYDLERTIELEPGEQLVEVELNANNHLPWTVEGARINAIQLVTVPGDLEAADVNIDVSFNDGEVTLADGDRIDVPFEATVRIEVVTDVTEEVHLHGYDILVPTSPETPGIIEFTADTPGRFELEFEQSGVFIAELLVDAS